jgi:exosortase
VLLFIALAWLGGWRGLILFEQVSLIGLAWSVPYALWGKGVGRLMLFPAWVLLFSVPVPYCLNALAPHLRTFAAATAVGILNGIGVGIGREATRIVYMTPPDTVFGVGVMVFSVDVADACSGIRTLFVITVLAAGYAHFFLGSRLQRWALLACSVPMAILGNVLRILSICTAGVLFGEGAATRFCHDYLPFAIFLASALLLIPIGRRIPRFILWLRSRRRGRPDDDT